MSKPLMRWAITVLLAFIIFAAGLFYIFYSHRTASDADMEMFYEWQTEEAPLSSKEKAFTDSLSKLGFQVHISHPYFDRLDFKVDYKIDVESDTIQLTDSNYMQLMRFRDDLVFQLNDHIIEDSGRRRFIESINVRFSLPDARNKVNRRYANNSDYIELKKYPIKLKRPVNPNLRFDTIAGE